MQKKEAVYSVRGFAEQVASFKDGASKARALARLADILWDYDEPYARQLFTKAIGLTDPRGDAPPAEAQSLNWLRAELVAAVAKRDSALAKQLTERDDSASGGADNTLTNFRAAYEALKTQPEQAVEFAKRSLQSGVTPSMSFLLVKLRQTNPAAANELFLLTLRRLSAEPAVDADTLLQLGTYIFTSPRINPRDPNTPPGTVEVVGVGSVLVVDITADRPDIPRPLVVEYLRTAAGVVSRPLPVPEQRAKMYAAAYLLLRQAYKHAPELTSPISAAMQSLAQDVPREMTYDETYKNLERGPKKSLDEMLREIGKASDGGYRDAQYLALVYDLWQQSDFTNAAKINDKISHSEARGHLETIINFGRAARLLEKGDGDSVAQAEGVSARLSPGLERAVLMLAIAGAHARSRDSQRAAEALSAARTEISKVGPSHRPYLLIEAAGLGAAQSDVALALSALNEAVRQLNAQKAEDPDPVWKRHVKVGGLWRDFPLSVKGVNFELSRPLRALVKLDLQGTTSSVRALDNEELLARVLPALAEGMLR